MSEQRRRGRVTLSREPDHRAVHSDIIRAMPSCSQSTNSGDNNRSCRPSQFLAVSNRPSQSGVHPCPCSHALRAHARCTVTQLNMRDVPLHADRVRDGSAARSSCTFTMRSFRGVHGNLCVPANYAVQAAARPATARACLCEDPLVYSTKCGKTGITRRGSFCSGWSRAGAAHATGAGDTLAPVLAPPPPSPSPCSHGRFH